MKQECSRGRAWAEVDLSALEHNFLELKKLVSSTTKVMAVVKANAYGHGAVPCAKTLIASGADYLAVATVDEALQLRSAQISTPILVLGYTAPEHLADLVSCDITATVYSMEQAQALSEEATRQDKVARLHIKINTGMERIGFAPDAASDIVAACRLPGLNPEGIYTHLACADEEDASGVHEQYRLFTALLEQLAQAGLQFSLRHILNSAGILDFPEYQLDMVRAGIVLYGYYPSCHVHKERAELRPVMSVKARVIHLHRIEKGTGVSYGWTYRAPEAATLATVSIGYADGYFRLLSNRGMMLADGKPVRVTGRICMDQCMIDVTSVNTIDVGDEIIIIGKRGDARITADDLAKCIGTISYEILCTVGERLPRLYMKNGQEQDVLNGFN